MNKIVTLVERGGVYVVPTIDSKPQPNGDAGGLGLGYWVVTAFAVFFVAVAYC